MHYLFLSMRESRPLSLALGGLVALAAAMGIGRFLYTPILPMMVEALPLTNGQAGFIASVNFGGYLAGAMLAATPVLAGSNRRWLLYGLTMSGISTGAMAFASTVTAFVVWRFVGGVASAFVLVCASTLILDRLQDAGRADLSALHFAGVGVGIALSALLVWIVDNTLGFGWRAQWVAGGSVSMLALIVVARLVPAREESRHANEIAADTPGRAPAGFVLAYGLCGFGYVITATFLVAIVRASEALRAFEPVVWLLVGLAAVPSVGLWTWASARIGIVQAFSLACVLEALSITASVLWTDALGIAVAAILFGGTFMGIVALGLIGARQLSSVDPRRIIAVMTVAFGIGQVVGPGFAGVLYDQTGSFMAPSLAAAGALVAAGLLAISARSRWS